MTSSAFPHVFPATPQNLNLSRKLSRRPKHDRRQQKSSLKDTPMDDPPPPPQQHTLALVPHRAPHGPVPFREDCWTEEATRTLIDAWGTRYLDLNRGNLRQKHWQEVADAVNARHGAAKKTRRTDVQCKNRIDTLKKKYKIEKSRASAAASYASPWPFFHRLDSLIGPIPSNKSSLSSLPAHRRSGFSAPVPVAPRSASVKRPAFDDSSFRRNFFSTFAAAAAAATAEDSDATRKSRSSSAGRLGGAVGDTGGCKELAQAIATFGEIYERVEGSKQRQVIELEMKRMQFAKELEIQRMEMLVDMQLQFEKSKRQKRQSNGADNYL
uniref:Myb/SANT-like DNA-binding domain-containing protein n=1 Tax=Kalanchoe fedtschenkoi TaxID=63787 RepID=A0A7N0RGU5_KALFE